MEAETLILGAGPAGLACAMELSRADRKSIIVEKDELIGGLAKTLEFWEGDDLFRTDIGPHRFFSKNRYLYDFIEDLLDEEWRKVPRCTRQYIDGKFYDYPVNAMQVFKNIGPFKAARILFDYGLARIRYRFLGKRLETFEDYVVANFGRTLAEFSMINYTEKIWGIPAATIHPDWARQRISGLNFLSLLKNTFNLKKKIGKAKKGGGPKSLVDEFYYPQYGTGRIYEEIGKRLEERGNEIHRGTQPVKIKHNGTKVTEVICEKDGEQFSIKPEFVVESIPITQVLKLLDPPPPQEVFDAANSLKWRAQVYLFLTLDKDQVTKDNWIYFPNKSIPFGRTSEMKNFSADMAPEGKTSFFIEFFAFEGDEIWQMDKDQLLDLVMPYFEDFGFFTRDDVRNHYVMRRGQVYPVYDMTYTSHLDTIKGWLDKLENLIYLGRPGRFKYTNQDHSLEMGIVSSRMIIEGRKYDLDPIGSENEYFESGPVYEKRL